jgi:hypothetical protein
MLPLSAFGRQCAAGHSLHIAPFASCQPCFRPAGAAQGSRSDRALARLGLNRAGWTKDNQATRQA